MSAGHHHDGGGSRSVLVVQRLLQNPKIRDRLHSFHVVNQDYDLPYLAGYSKDGKTIYIDRHLPDVLKAKFNGTFKEFRPRRHLIDHETFEKAVIDVLGWSYAHAHGAATAYERLGVTKEGVPWDGYSDALRPYIKAAEHERLEKVPSDLDMTPYYAPPVDKALIAHMEKAMGGQNLKKKAKAEVEYSDSGHPDSHCGPTSRWKKGNCKHFLGPHGCELVRGYIKPQGWCKLWAADSKA